MSARRDWLAALYASGVTPAAFLPDAAMGRASEPPEESPAESVELVEDPELRIHPVFLSEGPSGVDFLDGIQQWKVIGYERVVPIAVAYVAAAVRRRGPDGRLCTADREEREIVMAPSSTLGASRRAAIAAAGLEVLSLEDAPLQPGQVLEALRRAVHGARLALEKSLGERSAARLAAEEWLVVDGQLSVSAALAHHPRVLGVIKSHGAQFLEGRHLEQALTIPAGHRTSVFRVLGGHGRTAVDSWYLRLWPWEGNDLHYGLLRIEARAHAESVAAASHISGWLLGERAPLATPDARFDRLLYPIHDVETYLRSRAPRDLVASPAARLPRTGP